MYVAIYVCLCICACIWGLQVADIEKFPYQPENKSLFEKLKLFVQGCATRPSEKPALAAAGELQYDYSKRLADLHSTTHSKSFTSEAAKECSQDEFVSVSSMLEDESERQPHTREGKPSAKTKAKAKAKAIRNIEKSETLQKIKALQGKLNKTIDSVQETTLRYDKAKKSDKDFAVFCSPKLFAQYTAESEALEPQKRKMIALQDEVSSMDDSIFSSKKAKIEEEMESSKAVLATFSKGANHMVQKALQHKSFWASRWEPQ